ncbi:putative ATP-dependent endonuclease of OLD family [Rathayibacter sp. PhB151]|uniref:ATP-dependent nuclease n=1 Tax=Rathayibacter sp. PhB151 TaxID=2485189 RepID=UPI0010623E94|nr:AAA family ATPase [Rathayibacter sp. PhB151]TDX81576.1 putative ATP-dependent endonuclease of OLD family [Rathayibacter sp. PhB151]
MHISKLSLVNYRNFAATTLEFNAGVNTVIGENGAGKSNLFRAVRLLLDANMLASAYRLNEEDFHRPLGEWRGHWIIIGLEFEQVSEDESIQALFLHGVGVAHHASVESATYNLIFRPRHDIRVALSQLPAGDTAGLTAVRKTMTVADYEVIFTGRSTGDFTDPQFYRAVVGDFDKVIFPTKLDHAEIGTTLPKQLSVAKEISFSFVPALRDVVRDFQENRPNPLRNLLRAKSGEIDLVAFQEIVDKVVDLNQSIEEWPDVGEVTADIRQTIRETVGNAYSPSSLRIRSDLPSDADRLFQSLKLFVGEDGEVYEGGIDQLSLGGANLIFLTLKLLEFQYSQTRQPIANFLLIEEPEAHIHTHIQKTLFERLNYDATQIIYSTHSTQISEVSHVQNMNILGRHLGVVEAFQPAKGLDAKLVRNIQRYLDAVRSNLLFARSVVLVEGDAEEILIPAMVKKLLGVGLDELGISLVNIRSTGFENVASLFHDNRIRKRCAIITDLDAAIEAPQAGDQDATRVARHEHMARSAKSGAERKTRLETFTNGNQWLGVFFAPHTFEVELVASGNRDVVVGLVDDIWSKQTNRDLAEAGLRSEALAYFGKVVLHMAEREGKGWFAVRVASEITPHIVLPNYILEAIRFVHPELSNENWCNILAYRLRIMVGERLCTEADREQFARTLEEFRAGDKSLKELAAQAAVQFPDDEINQFLEMYVA